MPWGNSMRVVGEFARDRGAEIPSRLVSSAKSWLCHNGVDRNKPILPWENSEDAEKVSPVEASAAYLEHIRRAWNHSMASDDASRRLEDQEILLTVPASFDAVARELTVKAAEMAGLENVTLLEEPQAAFYAWIEGMDDAWRKAVKAGDTILVCDIGGGTTDFSLMIRVGEDEGDLTLERVAVGDHILVGGENMDLTLAYTLQRKFKEQGHNPDSWQMRILWHRARDAKEKLLLNPDVDTVPVSIPGRGTGLISGTLRSELSRTELESVLLDGFFPRCEPSDRPAGSRRVGMKEFGLPYAEDPAITRYLAKFLGGGGDGPAGGERIIPTAVLFNGGVMKGDSLRNKLLEVLHSWEPDPHPPIRELESRDLDFAVARGAAYYGLARRGKGIRIRGGTGRSYYIGVESSMPAVPGVPSPLKAVCVVPFGMEEGTEAVIPDRQFGLVVGEQVVFHFLGSTLRKEDRCGDVVEAWEEEIPGDRHSGDPTRFRGR